MMLEVIEYLNQKVLYIKNLYTRIQCQNWSQMQSKQSYTTNRGL